MVADEQSRQLLATIQQAQVQHDSCKWINKMVRKIHHEPAKYSDFQDENCNDSQG